MLRFIILLACMLSINAAFAATHIINFTVDYKTVNFAGKSVKAIAVNQQIPAPTLHFHQGDQVTINVTNNLTEETAIHWHGIILPWQMDGVRGVTQQGIQPGKTFQYRFTLHQSGTYWYHAHADLQEQQGLYGALIIDPPQQPAYQYSKDYVVVLSDWSNTHPDQILANLKKEGDYYSPRFPLQPSLSKFISDYRKSPQNQRQLLLDDYKMMQQMRMSVYDFSDVAYNAFLLNGKPNSSPWTAPVNVGDVVRLRFIGAGGSTIFHVKIPGTTMKMVHVDGNDVEPYSIDDFTIAPGETYDVLVKIKNNNPSIIYAESLDTLGAAYGALTTSPHQFVNYRQVARFPEPLPVTRDMMKLMMGAKYHGSTAVKPHPHHSAPAKPKMSMEEAMKLDPNMKMDDNAAMHHDMANMQSSAPAQKPEPATVTPAMKMDDAMPGMKMSDEMEHTSTAHNMNHSMQMPTEPSIIGDTISAPSSMYDTSIGIKYQPLKAAVKTNDPGVPVAGVIKMELFGYMDRYIWFINGVPEHLAKPIVLNPGKRYRIVFINNSMMRHPMHIHGHWFILRKGHGAYDPLLHTIDVQPGATITADLDTDASGQWLFHCHLLYHMMSGMSRVMQYSTLIELMNNEVKPQHIVKASSYINRPIVRVDEARPIDPSLVMHPMAHRTGWWFATMLDVGADPSRNIQRVTYKGLYGSDFNKLELFTNDAETQKGTVQNADIDIFYWHLLDQFWAVKGGVNYFYRPAATPYWQPGLGIEGLMPYYINTDVRGYYYGGSAKLDLELSRDTQLLNNCFVRLGVRSILASKTVTSAAIGDGLSQMRYIIRPYYRLMPGLNLIAEYELEQDYGAFKTIQQNNGEASRQNTLTVGLSVLF